MLFRSKYISNWDNIHIHFKPVGTRLGCCDGCSEGAAEMITFIHFTNTKHKKQIKCLQEIYHLAFDSSFSSIKKLHNAMNMRPQQKTNKVYRTELQIHYAPVGVRLGCCVGCSEGSAEILQLFIIQYIKQCNC